MTRDAELHLYQLQADIAKALANPVRLRVLDLIGGREVSYAALLAGLGISKTNLSQHLAILRKSAVLAVRREGRHVFYRLRYPEIKSVCGTMRGVLAKHLAAGGRQARRARMLTRRAG